jgi:hypothetical protein
MLPFLRENVMEFERRTPLESEQVTDAPNREIHSVSRVGQAFRPQSERMQSGRRAELSQLACHATVGRAAKLHRHRRETNRFTFSP